MAGAACEVAADRYGRVRRHEARQGVQRDHQGQRPEPERQRLLLGAAGQAGGTLRHLQARGVPAGDTEHRRRERGWERNGIGWMAETFPSKLKGCVNVTVWYGSSTYDTEQMSRLIDAVVEDCKAVGIETMTPAELDALVSRWGEVSA